MAPKHALLSSSSSSGPGLGGINNREESCSSSPAAWLLSASGMVAVCLPRNGMRTRALRGTLARCLVTMSAVLMLMMQSCLAADGKTRMLCCLQPVRMVVYP